MRVTVAAAPSQNTPDIPKWQVREDASRIGKDADLVGFTEIREEDDFDAVTSGLGILWKLWVLAVNCPIAVRRSVFRVLASHYIQLHKADGSLPTPARYLAWVLLKRRLSLSKVRTVMMNTHMINRPDAGVRAELWWDSFAIIKDTVSRMHKEGHNVIITGDFNKVYFPKFHPEMVWVAGQDSIIKIGVLPAEGWEVKVENVWTVGQHADHNARVARLIIRKRG